MILKFKKLNPEATIPSFAHAGDSGMDVSACETVVVKARSFALIKTGIAAIIPTGYEIQVRPRSGLQCKHGIVGAWGTVDEAIVGIDTETSRVIYDVDLLIAVYVKEMYKSDSDVFGKTPEDIYNSAVDQVYNDTIQVCLSLGDEGPIVISRFFALDGVDEAYKNLRKLDRWLYEQRVKQNNKEKNKMKKTDKKVVTNVKKPSKKTVTNKAKDKAVAPKKAVAKKPVAKKTTAAKKPAAKKTTKK